ncbi:hypothetical protein BCF33_1479 [Hasllibacter halocynthiae]|uniref:Glycosyl transferase n=1 Tax=Hasllibacter halocynthiae TaxID=595589 RepID=A0A2T0X105_9RHOB|nr:glycosyl transferase [Hasllibacter halocynthiae]PRY92628.1 hypothetical protein BCF33_1479 [Hasllibacter halocynthiae]
MTAQIVCIKWGTKYPALYVNRLYGMCARNMDRPFRFVCFTDDAEGIRPEVDCLPLPPLDANVLPSPGQWGKSRLWAAELGDLEGPFLFVDLDCVVIGPLGDFFDRGSPQDVILARDPAKPLHRIGQTSVYRAPVGKLASIRAAFLADPLGTQRRFRYEQRYVTRMAPGGVRFWPRDWVVHYRRRCRRTFPLNYALPPKPPKDARIVIFAGHLNPPQAIEGRYRAGGPATPREHLAATFDRGRRYVSPRRHLLAYMAPAPWIEEAWRE